MKLDVLAAAVPCELDMAVVLSMLLYRTWTAAAASYGSGSGSRGSLQLCSSKLSLCRRLNSQSELLCLLLPCNTVVNVNVVPAFAVNNLKAQA